MSGKIFKSCDEDILEGRSRECSFYSKEACTETGLYVDDSALVSVNAELQLSSRVEEV